MYIKLFEKHKNLSKNSILFFIFMKYSNLYKTFIGQIMKKAFLLVIFFVLTLNSMQSQVQQIAVQHPTLDTARFFGNLQTAIDSAWVGSTIYLPAILGDYTTSGFTVNKKLFIYGVGHYPDSTKATGRTVISGNVTISQGADSGSISGLHITGNVTFTSVNVFYFNRNRLNILLLNSSTKNILLQQNVVAGYEIGRASCGETV